MLAVFIHRSISVLGLYARVAADNLNESMNMQFVCLEFELVTI